MADFLFYDDQSGGDSSGLSPQQISVLGSDLASAAHAIGNVFASLLHDVEHVFDGIFHIGGSHQNYSTTYWHYYSIYHQQPVASAAHGRRFVGSSQESSSSWLGTGVGFVEGSLEAAAGLGFGAATSWTGIGAVAGGAIALHGLDVAQAALRGADTFTSEGLQAAGLSESTANAIDMGITGVDLFAAGAQILPYSLFGPALSGGGRGTSLLSAVARGFVPPIGKISDDLVSASSGPVWNALRRYYNTGTQAAIVGRVASDASRAIGIIDVEYAVYQGAMGNDW